MLVADLFHPTDNFPFAKAAEVRVPGTKTVSSVATLPVAPEMWPWVTRAVPAPLAYKWLREYWVRARKAVGAGDVRLRDLRHFTAQTLVNGGARTPRRSRRCCLRRPEPSHCLSHCHPNPGTRVLLSRYVTNSGGRTRTDDPRIMIPLL